MVKKYVTFLCFLISVNLVAQKDSVVVKLDEIFLPISKVKDFSKGYFKTKISDSLIGRNINSLTDVLKFNSFIYFKENGLGMVSSPSFRGTNASQTAVIWNGININSQLNGQTDFNTISSNSFDNITVRSGGGSVLFGSGAIGGTVHLNNTIEFLKQQNHQILLNYGSFNTSHFSYNFKKANAKSYLKLGVGYNNSYNDFEYLNSNLFNENGSFYNYNVDVNFGYKLNSNNELKIFSNSFFSDRNLSRTLNAPSNDSYKDLSLKNLVEWVHYFSPKESLNTRFAYIFDEYKFFDDYTNEAIFSIGSAKRKILKLDYNNSISRKIQLNGILGFETTKAEGTSFSTNKRDVFSAIFSYNHLLSKKLSYGLQFRKEFLKEYNSPLLYSLGIEQKINKHYIISFNTSKNFRIPTFNDLYWQPGGNLDLKPEKSYQFEIGNSLTFKNLSVSLNGFYIKSSDLIQWVPNQTGNWSPLNVNSAKNIGLELALNFKKSFDDHNFSLQSNYSYTNAKDLKTNKRLISVPINRANFLFDYSFKEFKIYYQHLFNGNVAYLVNTIPSFSVANLGVNYQLPFLKNKPIIGFKINNIYNKYYQNTLSRPMPGVNYQITTNFNF
ncbi:TonB-dependent receptor [uncultured Polaribacter sp.]|uniref:TonB-dependent receptor plug domain-containing protein n=1 Tax=uncultured Polaribacter sp. TaxID=174711 RepID=UPI002635B428|nr:TonB-dependent receptor [uncultured Polaribacter sp.]